MAAVQVRWPGDPPHLAERCEDRPGGGARPLRTGRHHLLVHGGKYLYAHCCMLLLILTKSSSEVAIGFCNVRCPEKVIEHRLGNVKAV